VLGTIDDALDIFAGTGPEYSGGFSNHGPMAAEALIALGRADAMIRWVESYKRRLLPAPRAGSPISQENWQQALGDMNRIGDWTAFFDRELAEAPWAQVLDIWVKRLAPGLVSATMHCLIRTAHAVRSLATHQNSQRLHELAEGLGYWGASYLVLPGGSVSHSGTKTATESIRLVKRLPQPHELSGSITDGLARLNDFPEFDAVSGLVDTQGDASLFISDLTRTFGAVYLANAHDLVSTIIFVHGVTGPSAIRLLAPHLSSETSALALRYGWQAAAALYATFASAPMAEADLFAAADGNTDDLIDRAVGTGDEHAIKFTEVCIREFKVAPNPIYIAAAWDAISRLG
jgi:hypothetical protein